MLSLILGEQIWPRSKLVYMDMLSLGSERQDCLLNWRVNLSKTSINHRGDIKNQKLELWKWVSQI